MEPDLQADGRLKWRNSMKTVGDHLYVAALLPLDQKMKIDERAYRRFLQHFLKNERFVRMGGGLCINPEAGEIFYLTREEKRRVLEIAMERSMAVCQCWPAPGL